MNLDLLEAKGLRPTQNLLRAANTIDSVITRIWIVEMEKKAILKLDNKWQKTFRNGIKISEIFEC